MGARRRCTKNAHSLHNERAASHDLVPGPQTTLDRRIQSKFQVIMRHGQVRNKFAAKQQRSSGHLCRRRLTLLQGPHIPVRVKM